ncbi:unnamed protein product, partial [Echinostoma caproni]|uniref:Phospholipase A-2-activating protein n=1 Tax=Echinostoma caproni TaxID=27848 RepID=A0A183AKT5_9TREM
EGTDYAPGDVLQGHDNYVTALAVYTPQDPVDHLIYTGSNDKLIRAFSFGHGSPKFVLKGHSDTVCGISVDKFNTLVSVSWDKTAKVWKNGKCLSTIKGHESAVWCVLYIAGSELEFEIATGSADRSIRLWKVVLSPDHSEASFSLVRSFLGHADCVRSLAALDQHRFLSASNDASIRAWDLRTGTCVGEFYGHTNFVYNVATQVGVPVFVSSGEDRSVRVWSIPGEQEWAEGRQFNALQSIPLPCQSAWCVTLSSKGDIIVGGSDSIIRLFSSEPTRQASADAIKTYEAELASSEIQAPNASDMGDLNMDKLPGIEALLCPGKREGQVIMIKQDNRILCYQWSMAESRWMEIGDVVGAQSPNAAMFEGKEYDFVFTVDIADHLPPLKLPYNRSQDPWFAAQEFLQRNDLPADYLDTVANFIIRNAGPLISPPTTSQSEYVDPFTGSSRYIPGGGSQTTAPPQEPLETYFPADSFIPLKNISLAPLLDKIFPVLDLLRCLVFWRQACRVILSPNHWSRISEVSLNHPDTPPANLLLVLRLMSNVLAADGPGYLKSSGTYDSDALITVINWAPSMGQFVQNSKFDFTTRKPHQIAFATLIHNLTVLSHRLSACPVASTRIPHLITIPGTALLTLTNPEGDTPDEELQKTRRIRFVASAAVGILLQDVDTKSMDEVESELIAWERAQKVFRYWADTPAALPKVRSCAAALLRLLE